MAAKGYSTSKWAGQSNYECDSCPFATLDEQEMKDHVSFHQLGEPENAGKEGS